MAYKKIPHEVKVNALKEALLLKDIQDIAEKYEFSKDTINNCCNKIINSIDATIITETLGVK